MNTINSTIIYLNNSGIRYYAKLEHKRTLLKEESHKEYGMNGMKALIIYDSVYGNTEKIARAIAGAITPFGEVKVLRAGEASPSDLGSIDLLIVGSPTQGGKPTPAIQEFLNKIPANALRNINVASFDTRVKMFGTSFY